MSSNSVEVAAPPKRVKLPKGLGHVQQTDQQTIFVTAESPAAFKAFGGSATFEFNDILVRTVAATMWNPADGQGAARFASAAASLVAFKPVDEIEGMLAAQATAMHYGAMECFRRAMGPGLPLDAASKLRRDGANLARAMTDMLKR